MRQNLIETVMGAVVLAIAGYFLVFAYSSSQLDTYDGYLLSAKFDRIDGVNVGSDVRLSGVKIGSVTSLAIDQKTFLAKIQFTVDPKIQLPKDSSAEIVSSGLLGDKYLALVPGGSEEILPPEGEITYTQSSVNLESLIGQAIFRSKSDTEEEKTQ